jgi:hypothetical protein
MLLYIAPGEYLNTVVETTPVSQLPGIVIQKQTAPQPPKKYYFMFFKFFWFGRKPSGHQTIECHIFHLYAFIPCEHAQ